MKIFSERLRELRKESGLSQRAMAKILSIAQPSYSRYELGTGEPSLETLAAVAKYFEVSSDYLLGADDFR